jgi:hypothetical protein
MSRAEKQKLANRDAPRLAASAIVHCIAKAASGFHSVWHATGPRRKLTFQLYSDTSDYDGSVQCFPQLSTQ